MAYDKSRMVVGDSHTTKGREDKSNPFSRGMRNSQRLGRGGGGGRKFAGGRGKTFWGQK